MDEIFHIPRRKKSKTNLEITINNQLSAFHSSLPAGSLRPLGSDSHTEHQVPLNTSSPDFPICLAPLLASLQSLLRSTPGSLFSSIFTSDAISQVIPGPRHHAQGPGHPIFTPAPRSEVQEHQFFWGWTQCSGCLNITWWETWDGPSFQWEIQPKNFPQEKQPSHPTETVNMRSYLLQPARWILCLNLCRTTRF